MGAKLLHPDVAFSFLQKTIFDRILDPEMIRMNKPLVGYISIRVCLQTQTFMGMQQFGPHSVMVELVGFRTPEANHIMNEVQRETLLLNTNDEPNYYQKPEGALLITYLSQQERPLIG